ncbi:hypothetical protein Dimus_036530, partial [Dionaea muscipula]
VGGVTSMSADVNNNWVGRDQHPLVLKGCSPERQGNVECGSVAVACGEVRWCARSSLTGRQRHGVGRQ